jgi:ribonuclease P protein component
MINSVRRKEFEYLLIKGKWIHSGSLSFKYLEIKDQNKIQGRFAFISSGKVLKKATERNLFKRRGRYIINKNKHTLKEGLIGGFFAKKGITELSFKELEKEILSLLKTAGALINTSVKQEQADRFN